MAQRIPLTEEMRSGGPWTRKVAGTALQYLWWASSVDPSRIGYARRGPLTALRRAGHRSMRREIDVGILAGGPPHRRRVHHLAFWLNERTSRCRFLIDPDPASVDVLFVFSQDPLKPRNLSAIEAAIARARPRTPVLNHPKVHGFYHRPDAFDRLDEAGVPVPRRSFGPADVGRTMVMVKRDGAHGGTVGPVPYAGEEPGARSFEYIDVREEDALYSRCRAHFVFGRAFGGLHFFSPSPVVKWGNAVSVRRDCLLSAEELRHVETIARVSGLDFFSVDFLRVPSRGGAPVFTDLNVFPTSAYVPFRRGLYGEWHDLELPLTEWPDIPHPSPWPWIDEKLAALAGRPPTAL